MKTNSNIFSYILLFTFLLILQFSYAQSDNLYPTEDNNEWFVLEKSDLNGGAHHNLHSQIFGKYVTGYNKYILQAIDTVQNSAPEGGGYFIGITADPPESPIGYNLCLFDKELINAPRTTSYCSGASYAGFIEAMNLIYPNLGDSLSYERYESLRQQEEDGSRRNDGVKFWGKWNDDGCGTQYALVQYAQMGKQIKPINARPGDFVNISWKSGNGHSVIFLGWYIDETGEKNMVYWSSQKGTNGLGDDVVPIEKIKEVVFVRLTNPENIFTFDVNKEYERNIPYDNFCW